MYPNQEKVDECISVCNQCRDECEITLFQHCLQEGGEHAEPSHVTLMADCIEICQTAANFMLRSSSLHGKVCSACADICEACARSCEKFSDDEQMTDCADTCKRCAEMCREMAVG